MLTSLALIFLAEIFHLWVIEAPQEVAEEFPADKAGLNVLFVPSEEPYHEGHNHEAEMAAGHSDEIILFAPHAFGTARQLCARSSPSPLVFLHISTHFTATHGIPLPSSALKSTSFQ